MNRITVVADSKIPFLKGALEPFASVRYLEGNLIDRNALADADALLIRTRTLCNQKLLQGSPVKFIATATIGFDHIDAEFCAINSIDWINAPGCNSASVQQYVASVLANLSLTRGYTLTGKTIGIVGVGHVGSKIEKLARILGMRFLLNDPPRERLEGGNQFVSLETMLKESDVVTLHVPLNRSGEDKTLHLFSENTIGKMKPGAWLINTSRGEVVNSVALKSALDNQLLSGAVLDVWENEPLIDLKLLEKASIATPHIAGYSTDGKKNGTVQVVRSLGKYFNLPLDDWEPTGMPEPQNPVIQLNGFERTQEELLCEAIINTYNVMEDDRRFRSYPAEFEKLRGNYPVRREFPAYQVQLPAGNEEFLEKLKTIGFQVI